MPISKAFESVLSESHIEKIIRIAKQAAPSNTHVPFITNHDATEYCYRPATWWASGFFPGCLWAIYERKIKYPMFLPSYNEHELMQLAVEWQAKLKGLQFITTTHDIGFMIMPSYSREYDLSINGNGDYTSAGKVLVQAADSLMTRWNEKVGMLRSWNSTATKIYQFDNMQTDFLVIVDNMMNLDLLYKASEITGDHRYSQVATTHADNCLKYHVRQDYSTSHLVVFDPVTGDFKIALTHEGYAHDSCWSQGHAWAVYGFASVYMYTKQQKYLTAAKKLADYFISQLGENGQVHWDFDAPRPCDWDTSAATIFCSGVLLMCKRLNNQQSSEAHHYLSSVEKILNCCLDDALTGSDGATILNRATKDLFQYSLDPDSHHGLVYADYYFLELGNRILELGLV